MTPMAFISFDAWRELWDTLTFQAPHNTTVVLRGTIVLGLACGIVGSFLLLRKRSLIADALSHATLPGVCVGFLVAVWLGGEGRSLLVLLPAAAVFGVLGVAFIHLLTTLPRVKEDAAIGVVLSVFFGLGVVLLGVIQDLPVGNKAGLNSFIFGHAATMRESDSNVIAILALAVLAVAVVAFKELRLICFDPSFAAGLGWSTLALDGLLLAMVTTLTVIGLHAVGAILMVALLIIPAASARYWTDRLTVMVVLAAAIGAVACHIGTAASAVIDNLPTGPSIVAACGSLFVVSMLLAPKRGVISAMWQRWALGRRVARQHLLRAMYEHGELAGRFDAVVTPDDLMKRRAWTPRTLNRILRRVRRRGEIARISGGDVFTERGLRAAARIVRTHRLWEYFLTSQADVAPYHVDRAADDIEHVLSDELIRDLEEELRLIGALPVGTLVPRSPHQLACKSDGDPATGGRS